MFQQNILSELIKISYEAGLLIMDIYNNKFEVNYKKDNSPVTNADKKAEEFILKKLNIIFPDIPIISEEAYSNKFIPDYDVDCEIEMVAKMLNRSIKDKLEAEAQDLNMMKKRCSRLPL